MPTLILSPQYNIDNQLLWKAAIELGWATHRLSSWRVAEADKLIVDPVIYIDGLFVSYIAEAFNKNLSEPSDDWLSNLDIKYSKRLIQLMSIGEARKIDHPIFVKPPNEKSIKAQVFVSGAHLTEYREHDVVFNVLVSEPVKWIKEFRCFAVDGKVATTSIYLRNGELQRQHDFYASEQELIEAKDFAQSVLDNTITPNPIVIDVGVIEDKGWAVVEINAAWGSGIYGCDPKQVLRVLERY